MKTRESQSDFDSDSPLMVGRNPAATQIRANISRLFQTWAVTSFSVAVAIPGFSCASSHPPADSGFEIIRAPSLAGEAIAYRGLDVAAAILGLPDVYVYNPETVDLRAYEYVACALRQMTPEQVAVSLAIFWGFWHGRNGWDSREAHFRLAVLARFVFAFPDETLSMNPELVPLCPNGGVPWMTNSGPDSYRDWPLSSPVTWTPTGPSLVGRRPDGAGGTGSFPDPLQQWRIASEKLSVRTGARSLNCKGDEFDEIFELNLDK